MEDLGSEETEFNKLKSYVSSLTTCTICLDNLNTPKSLPCLHTFCLGCLGDYFKLSRPGNDVCCPTCRNAFKFPPNGVADFPHNFLIAGLMGAKDLDDYCVKHPNKLAEAYCFTCKAVVCHSCSTTEHQRHECSSIKAAASKVVEHMDEAMGKVRLQCIDVRKDEERLEKDLNSFVSNAESEMKIVERKRRECLVFVDRLFDEVKGRLDRTKDEVLTDHKSTKSRLHERLDEISQIETNADAIRDIKKCGELVSGVDKVSDKVSSLLQNPVRSHHCFPTIRFVAPTSQASLDIGALTLDYGIAIACSSQHQPIPTSQHLQPVLIGSIVTNTDVWGVAHMDNKLFVVCKHSNTIDVYDARETTSFCRQPDIVVNGMAKANDIVSYARDRYLFVADVAVKCVWRVRPDTSVVERWISKGDSTALNSFNDPRSMSISATSNELVIVADRGLFVVGLEDTTSGVRRITLPKCMNPFHAVQTSNGTYVVCHTGWMEYDHDKQSDISEVDKTGRVLRTCSAVNSLKRNVGAGSSLQMTWPYYATFIDGERIIVIDRVVIDLDSDQVMIFDRSLKHVRSIDLTKVPGAKYARRMCYAANTGLLYLGASGKIDVFQLRK